jgi:hypothetical protein
VAHRLATARKIFLPKPDPDRFAVPSTPVRVLQDVKRRLGAGDSDRAEIRGLEPMIRAMKTLTGSLLRSRPLLGLLPLKVSPFHVIDDGSDLLSDVEGGPELQMLEPLREIVESA